MESNLFKILKSSWRSAIDAANKVKKAEFQDDADEFTEFWKGEYLSVFKMTRQKDGAIVFSGNDTNPQPSMCVPVNKVAEAVDLYGPTLYHNNPNRTTTPPDDVIPPIEMISVMGGMGGMGGGVGMGGGMMGSGGPPSLPGMPGMPGMAIDPMQAQQMAEMQAQAAYATLQQSAARDKAINRFRADLYQRYLNFIPAATGLKEESKEAVNEAIVSGMGVVWHELYRPPGANWKMPGSFYDDVKNLIIDTDMKSRRHAKWCARRCIKPVWEVEAEYGLEPGKLKASGESGSRYASTSNDHDERNKGETSDLVTYYKVWSKMGMGALLKKNANDDQELASIDRFGQYVHLVWCDSCDYPLNVPEELWDAGDEQAISQALQWETPFWISDGWPFSELAFFEVTDQTWPMALMSKAKGELLFLQWAYSFIASKIKTSSRDLVAILESAGEELKKEILSGKDYAFLKIKNSHGKTINEIVQFLQHPQMNGDVWRVIEAIEANFEKRIGLTELMYGMSSRQDRSAAESEIKHKQMSIRPDYLAECVESWQSAVASKEALMARWHCEPQDLVPVIGEQGAVWWTQLITPMNPSELIHQFDFSIEAGSVRKPNREKLAGDANQAIQTFMPFFMQLASAGQVQPVNSLIQMWGTAQDVDVSGMMVAPPPPPPMMPPPGGDPNGLPNGQPQQGVSA